MASLLAEIIRTMGSCRRSGKPKERSYS